MAEAIERADAKDTESEPRTSVAAIQVQPQCKGGRQARLHGGVGLAPLQLELRCWILFNFRLPRFESHSVVQRVRSIDDMKEPGKALRLLSCSDPNMIPMCRADSGYFEAVCSVYTVQ